MRIFLRYVKYWQSGIQCTPQFVHKVCVIAYRSSSRWSFFFYTFSKIPFWSSLTRRFYRFPSAICIICTHQAAEIENMFLKKKIKNFDSMSKWMLNNIRNWIGVSHIPYSILILHMDIVIFHPSVIECI